MSKISTPISYCRLIVLIASWYFVHNDPEVFVVMFLLQEAWHVCQILFLTSSTTYKEPELSKQLRIVVTRMSTAIMIFAVIRQAIDHTKFRLKSEILDDKTQHYCFTFVLLFFLDFMSAWFDQYSKYFAGDRWDKVQNVLEQVL